MANNRSLEEIQQNIASDPKNINHYFEQVAFLWKRYTNTRNDEYIMQINDIIHEILYLIKNNEIDDEQKANAHCLIAEFKFQQLLTDGLSYKDLWYAIGQITAAIEYNSKRIEFHLLLSRFYIVSKHFDAAIESANKAIELNPENIEAYNILAHIYIEQSDDEQSHWELAIHNTQLALKYAKSTEEIGQCYVPYNNLIVYVQQCRIDKSSCGSTHTSNKESAATILKYKCLALNVEKIESICLYRIELSQLTEAINHNQSDPDLPELYKIRIQLLNRFIAEDQQAIDELKQPSSTVANDESSFINFLKEKLQSDPNLKPNDLLITQEYGNLYHDYRKMAVIAEFFFQQQLSTIRELNLLGQYDQNKLSLFLENQRILLGFVAMALSYLEKSSDVSVLSNEKLRLLMIRREICSFLLVLDERKLESYELSQVSSLKEPHVPSLRDLCIKVVLKNEKNYSQSQQQIIQFFKKEAPKSDSLTRMNERFNLLKGNPIEICKPPR